jgi:hypothetical protein
LDEERFVDFFALDFLEDFVGFDRFVDFFAVDFRDDDFFAPDFLAPFRALDFLVDFFAEDFFVDLFVPDVRFGALSPSRRASDSAMAIACLRLVTFLCEPPLRSLPSFFSCMTLRTLSCVFLPYFAIWSSSVAAAGEVPTSVTELRAESKGRIFCGNMAAAAVAPLPDILATLQAHANTTEPPRHPDRRPSLR